MSCCQSRSRLREYSWAVEPSENAEKRDRAEQGDPVADVEDSVEANLPISQLAATDASLRPLVSVCFTSETKI